MSIVRKTKTTRATCVRKNVKDAKYVLSVGRGGGVWEGSGGGGGAFTGVHQSSTVSQPGGPAPHFHSLHL